MTGSEPVLADSLDFRIVYQGVTWIAYPDGCVDWTCQTPQAQTRRPLPQIIHIRGKTISNRDEIRFELVAHLIHDPLDQTLVSASRVFPLRLQWVIGAGVAVETVTVILEVKVTC